MTGPHPLQGHIATLTSLHHKASLIAPPLHAHVGLIVKEVALDTDALGTFAGDIARQGTPLEIAIKKARLSMEHTGTPLGLASEGSIGPHPHTPFITCDTEIVVFVNDVDGYVIHESDTALNIPTLSIDAEPGLIDIERLHLGGFPEHGVIVRPSDLYSPIFKGIHTLHALNEAVRECATHSPVGMARVESDFRAHHHPFRRTVIKSAATRLATRLAVLCPQCNTPGWGRVGWEFGAPCAQCRIPTELPLADILGCAVCDARTSQRIADNETINPAQCSRCNP